MDVPRCLILNHIAICVISSYWIKVYGLTAVSGILSAALQAKNNSVQNSSPSAPPTARKTLSLSHCLCCPIRTKTITQRSHLFSSFLCQYCGPALPYITALSLPNYHPSLTNTVHESAFTRCSHAEKRQRMEKIRRKMKEQPSCEPRIPHPAQTTIHCEFAAKAKALTESVARIERDREAAHFFSHPTHSLA